VQNIPFLFSNRRTWLHLGGKKGGLGREHTFLRQAVGASLTPWEDLLL